MICQNIKCEIRSDEIEKNGKMVNSVMNNVPQIYEYIEENERFGYIMENVQGKSFASLMMDEKHA